MRRLVFLFAVLWGGCPAESTGGPRVPPGPLGDQVFTDFFVDNQTDTELSIRWVIDGDSDSFGPVQPAEIAKFTSEWRYDQAPTPEQELERVEVLVDGLPVHRQDPVENALWTLEQSGDLVQATLVIDAGALGVDTAVPAGSCCCEFVSNGDEVTEDLLTEEQCGLQTAGQCIVVQSGRFTPHPCCPDADGDTCGG